MAAAVVQFKHTDIDSASATTVAAAFGSSVGSGSHIIVFVGWGTDPTKPSGVSDGRGSTYVEIGDCYVADVTDDQWATAYLGQTTSAGACTVTATWAGAKTWRSISVVECSSGNGLDDGAGQWQAGITAASSGTVTTTESNVLVVSHVQDTSNGTNTITKEAAATQIFNNGATDGMAAQYELRASGGAMTADFTLSASAYTLTMAVGLKSAGGGGSGIGLLMATMNYYYG